MYSETSDASLYDVLEIDPGCSKDGLRKAYRSLCKKFDPRVSGRQEDAARYDQILHAYITLSNKFGRREYDRSIGVDQYHHRGGTLGRSPADVHETTILSQSPGDVEKYYCPTCHGAGELFSYERMPGGLMRELRTFCMFCGGGGSWPLLPPAITMEESSSFLGTNSRSSRMTRNNGDKSSQ